jgi:hypothetical protein
MTNLAQLGIRLSSLSGTLAALRFPSADVLPVFFTLDAICRFLFFALRAILSWYSSRYCCCKVKLDDGRAKVHQPLILRSLPYLSSQLEMSDVRLTVSGVQEPPLHYRLYRC